MSSLLLSRVDSTRLYPVFLEKLQALLNEAIMGGNTYWVISGFRSYFEQTMLYNQGRTAPGKIVTNAKAGQSSHNFGISADLCRDGFVDRAGLQPDYRPESYEPLRALAPKHGLVWGGSWQFLDPKTGKLTGGDFPHVQMPLYVSAKDLLPLKNAFQSGGLVSTFKFLDNAEKAICI